VLIRVAAQFAVPDEKQSDFGTWSAADYQTDNKGTHLLPQGYVAGQKRDWFKQPDIVQRSFTSLLADLTNSLLKEELNDLGYSATATNLGSVQGKSSCQLVQTTGCSGPADLSRPSSIFHSH
jgi:hypothetical protein